MTDERGAPIACVLGEIDLVRALHLGGVRCAVAANPGEPARYSRANVRRIDRIDPGRNPAGMLERLLAFAAEQRERPVLFYDGDWDLLLISRERSRLESAFRFVVADESLVESVVDKGLFQELANRLDLPVPRGRVIHAGDADFDVLDLRFPVMVKPLTRNHDTWKPLARTKAVHVESPRRLRRTVGELGESGVDVIAQEAIPGGEERIESYHAYVDKEGAIVAEFTGRKIRTFPAEFGYTTALVITSEPDVRDLGCDLVQRMGLTGVVKLDFKRAPDGRLWLLDVNPRFNLWHHAGALAGINLPLLVYRDLVGQARPPARAATSGIRWCAVRHDLQAARGEGWGIVRWLRFVAGCHAISGFAVDDPLPLPRAALARGFEKVSRRAPRP